MNNQEDCQKHREMITAFVLGELEPHAADELKRHLDSCQVCQSLYQALVEEERTIRSAFEAIADRGDNLQENLIEQFARDNSAGQMDIRPKRAIGSLWSSIIKGNTVKLAVAAVIAMAVLGISNFWPSSGPQKRQWWLGPPAAWGRQIIAELERTEALVYREQSVFVSSFGSTHVSGTWNKNYQARDRSRRERYYEETDEDTFGNSKPHSVLQHVTYTMPDGNDLITYNISFELECYTVRKLKGGAYEDDPIENLRFYVSLLDKADRTLLTEVFDGKECVGFEINASKYGNNPEEWIDRIWFDIQTKLPVRIEKHGRPITGRPGTTMTRIQDQFEYYVQIPAEIFEPEIPDAFINAEPHEIQKAKIEQEKGRMIYADVPLELAAATAAAITSVENSVYRQRVGTLQDGIWKCYEQRELWVSRYDWREDIYSLGLLQRTEWYVTSQDDWSQTSFDFNDKNFSLIHVIVDYSQKTYKEITYTSGSHPDNPMDRIVFLVGWLKKADEFFENEEVEGKECFGFELSAKKYGTNPDTSIHRLWFDMETMLPVKIEFEWLEDEGPRKMVKDQFEWNAQLPEETFIPDVPADFTLERSDG